MSFSLTPRQVESTITAVVNGVMTDTAALALQQALDDIGVETGEDEAITLRVLLVFACISLADYLPYVEMTPDGVTEIPEARRG